MESVLLMGTIIPFLPTVNSNVDDRLQQYLDSIHYYINKSDFTDILFSENSEFDFAPYARALSQEAAEKNKHFEYIHILDAVHKNICCSEALMMREALKKSRLIQEHQPRSIWKITGRLRVKNINYLIRRHRKDDTVFLFDHSNPLPWVETYLFKASVSDLLNIYLLDEKIEQMDVLDKSIEETICEDIYRHNIPVARFSHFPHILNGVSSLGYCYTVPPFKRFAKNILLLAGKYSK